MEIVRANTNLNSQMSVNAAALMASSSLNLNSYRHFGFPPMPLGSSPEQLSGSVAVLAINSQDGGEVSG